MKYICALFLTHVEASALDCTQGGGIYKKIGVPGSLSLSLSSSEKKESERRGQGELDFDRVQPS